MNEKRGRLTRNGSLVCWSEYVRSRRGETPSFFKVGLLRPWHPTGIRDRGRSRSLWPVTCALPRSSRLLVEDRVALTCVPRRCATILHASARPITLRAKRCCGHLAFRLTGCLSVCSGRLRLCDTNTLRLKVRRSAENSWMCGA